MLFAIKDFWIRSIGRLRAITPVVPITPITPVVPITPIRAKDVRDDGIRD